MRRRKKKNLMPILIVILLTISLGYAFLHTDLTINGTSKINATSWNIHFEDLTPNPTMLHYLLEMLPQQLILQR